MEEKRGKKILRLEIEIDDDLDEDSIDPFEFMKDGQLIDKEQLCNGIYEVINRVSSTRVYHVTRQQQEKTQPINSTEWSKSFPWTEKVHEVNLNVFNHDSFRPQQLEIINSILSGKDTFVCLPTGSGKSLLFQLPPLIVERSRGVSLIILPLIALVSDHSRRFKMYDIPFKVLKGNRQNLDAIRRAINKAGSGVKPVLFSSPEMIENPIVFSFLMDLHRANQLDRIYLDEAHCLLEWGSTFRGAYLSLKRLRCDKLHVKQIIMMTGSAPPFIRRSLINTMKLENPAVFVRSHNRANLFLEITPKVSLDKDIQVILTLLSDTYANQSGIIYCRTKKNCEIVADKLKSKGYRSYRVFTGDMSQKEKTEILSDWLSDKARVVVATIAFGLGIDKPDCRFVIHYDLPSSLESYYQGVGRSGRDGRESHCVMFFDFRDIRKQDLLMKGNSKLYSKYMNFYIFCLESFRCRRYLLLNYFEKYEETCCDMCDNCILRKIMPTPKVIDVTQQAFRIHEILIEQGYADFADEEGGGGVKKFKKGKKGGAKGKKNLTTVKLIEALMKSNKETPDLSELSTLLEHIEAKRKEDICHFLVAGMIRDGLLVTKFINSKKHFGFLAVFASLEFDPKESIEKDEYTLQIGFKYSDRTIEKVRNYRPKKPLSEEELYFTELDNLRRRIFHQQSRSAPVLRADLDNNDDDNDQDDLPMTVEQFMPTEIVKILCQRKPRNYSDLVQIKIFPRDLYQYADDITKIFNSNPTNLTQNQVKEYDPDDDPNIDDLDLDELLGNFEEKKDKKPLEDGTSIFLKRDKKPKAKKETVNKEAKDLGHSNKEKPKKKQKPKQTNQDDKPKNDDPQKFDFENSITLDDYWNS